MYITKREILNLNTVIQHINSFTDEAERDQYLQDTVEDVDMFLSTLKALKKNKLINSGKEKICVRIDKHYTEKEIIEIFEENDLDAIVNQYSKQELTDMYLTFYSSRPLSSMKKRRIAQSIYHFIYTQNRAKALLGEITE